MAQMIYKQVVQTTAGWTQVRDNHANDGIDVFAIESGLIVGVFDVRFWTQDDITDWYRHDGWIRVFDLTTCSKPGIKLPLPEKPGWPESAYIDQATWNNIIGVDLWKNDRNTYRWIAEKRLQSIPVELGFKQPDIGILMRTVVNLNVRSSPVKPQSGPSNIVRMLSSGELVTILDLYFSGSNTWAMINPNEWVAAYFGGAKYLVKA